MIEEILVFLKIIGTLAGFGRSNSPSALHPTGVITSLNKEENISNTHQLLRTQSSKRHLDLQRYFTNVTKYQT